MRQLLKRIDEGMKTTSVIFGYQNFSEKDVTLFGRGIQRDSTYIRLTFSPTDNISFEFIFFRESNIRNIHY